jgi:hypothetical protein
LYAKAIWHEKVFGVWAGWEEEKIEYPISNKKYPMKGVKPEIILRFVGIKPHAFYY